MLEFHSKLNKFITNAVSIEKSIMVTFVEIKKN